MVGAEVGVWPTLTKLSLRLGRQNVSVEPWISRPCSVGNNIKNKIGQGKVKVGRDDKD